MIFNSGSLHIGFAIFCGFNWPFIAHFYLQKAKHFSIHFSILLGTKKKLLTGWFQDDSDSRDLSDVSGMGTWRDLGGHAAVPQWGSKQGPDSPQQNLGTSRGGGGGGVSAPREVVGVWGRGRDMGAIEEPLPKLQRGSLVFNPLSM